MDKELSSACLTVCDEVCRIVVEALRNERLTADDWDKVNKLFEMFAEEINERWKENRYDI